MELSIVSLEFGVPGIRGVRVPGIRGVPGIRASCSKRGLGVAMHEIAGNRTPGRLVPGFGDSRERANRAVTACTQQSCCVAVSPNESQIGAWPERLFHMNDNDCVQLAREVA